MDEATPTSILDQERESTKRRDSGSAGRAKVKLCTSALKSRLFCGAGRSKGSGALFKGGRRGRNWGQRPGRSVSIAAARYGVVAKVAWVQNGANAKARLSAALSYNQERDRAVWEKERLFFTRDKQGLDRDDIRKEIESKFGKDVAFHTVILSPGDNTVDIKNFVRETIREWEKDLGYQIDYYAVIHYNTDHYHAHLIVPGASLDKKSDVRFDRDDLGDLREAGNEYIARERNLDRDLDKLIEREFELSMEDRYDYQVQKEFGLDFGRYDRDQESLELSTSRELYQERQDLGLSRIYEPGRPFEHAELVEPVSTERQSESKDPLTNSTDIEANDLDWESDLTDYFYAEADLSPEQSDRDVSDNGSHDRQSPSLDEELFDEDRERDDHDWG